MKEYSVYCWTNKINNKRYIGITKRDPIIRWEEWRKKLYNPHLLNAINKYGIDNFERIVIKNNLDKKEAFKMERSLIKEFNTRNINCGYNISAGGASPTREGIKHTEETKQLIREKALGRKVSEETKNKMSISRSGVKNCNSLLTEQQVIDIRTRKKNGEKKRFVYVDYADIMALGGFKNVWEGITYKEVKV